MLASAPMECTMKYFVSSADQTSLEVYEYQGPAAAADLLSNIQGKYLSSEQNEENNRFPSFYSVFYS